MITDLFTKSWTHISISTDKAAIQNIANLLCRIVGHCGYVESVWSVLHFKATRDLENHLSVEGMMEWKYKFK